MNHLENTTRLSKQEVDGRVNELEGQFEAKALSGTTKVLGETAFEALAQDATHIDDELKFAHTYCKTGFYATPDVD